MTNGMPEGFEECAQCGSWHKPVSGVCGFKLEKDAAFVLHASGAALTFDMMAWVLRELGAVESHRYVSSPHQRHSYLWAGGALSRNALGPWKELASDGAEWVTKADYPPDVLLIETPGAHGVIKCLAVKE